MTWPERLTFAAVVVVLLSSSVACGVAGVRNLRTWRRVRTVEPLERAEVLAAERPVSRPPRTWPDPSAVEERDVVAGYRDYAYQRRDTSVLLGEVAMLAAGAALGASLPRALTEVRSSIGAGVAIGVGVVGQVVRTDRARYWVRVAALYERRLLALHRAEGEDGGREEAPATTRSRWRRAWDVLLGRE